MLIDPLTEADDHSDLPGVLAEIASVAGRKVALQIASERGGTEVNIPARPRPDHWLTKAAGGMEPAKAICDYFAIISAEGRVNGVRIKLPLADAALRADRWRSIIKSDLSTAEIARVMGVDARTVYRYRAKYRRLELGGGNVA